MKRTGTNDAAFRTNRFDAASRMNAQMQSRIDKAKETRKLIPRVLVDTGSGGAMAAALLKGQVRQFASFYCLPIGDKPAAQATSFTAAMVLQPMIAPLKNEQGQYDRGHVAEHVIVACNSASVRTKGALTLMKNFCADVKRNPYNYALGKSVIDNILVLAEKIEQDPKYLDHHIHEIVTPTAKAASDKTFAALTTGGRDSYFVRVESTAGTCKSHAYPKAMEIQLTGLFEEEGYKLSKHLSPALAPVPLEAGLDTHPIDHHVFIFVKDGAPDKTVYFEGRGNPHWVAAIEGGTHEKQGKHLVHQSKKASALALEAHCEATHGSNCLIDHKAAFSKSPDLGLLCCTHYPAMKEALSNQAGENTEFLNQATVVRDLSKDLPGMMISDNEIEPLSLVMTVGSIKENTVDPYLSMKSRHTGEDIVIPTSVKPAMSAPETTKATISKVVETTMREAGINDTGHGIYIYTQDEKDQKDFETLHKFMGLLNSNAILKEQYYTCKTGDWDPEGNPKFSNFRADGDRPLIAPASGGDDATIHAVISKAETRKAISELATLVTTGESRGVDRMAVRVDVGRQLLASTAQIVNLIKSNAEKRPANRQPASILTGFTVIHNEDKVRVGGENDGPPGAVILAKTFVENDTPVILITDDSAEASLLASLEHIGLATLKPGLGNVGAGLLTLADYELNKLVTLEVAIKDDKPAQGYELRLDNSPANIRQKLEDQNLGLFITGERLSPPLRSMTAVDVSAYNMDMNDLFTKWPDGKKPYMIGIGDGGNEYGTGNISQLTRDMRLPNLVNVVNRGPAVAATPEVQTDSVILASVSNTGFMALAMSARVALNPAADLTGIADDYHKIIHGLYNSGISFDGVNKGNALTVDGRELGVRAQSMPSYQGAPLVELGTEAATHHHMLWRMERTFDQARV